MPPRKRPPAQSSVIQTMRDDSSRYLQPFLEYLDAECGMSANTIRAYGTDLRQFVAWLDQRKLTSIRAIDLPVLSDYLRELHQRELAPTTVARHLVSIKMLFRYLVLEGVLTESAVELVSSPKLWQHLPKVLSPEMVDRLLAAPSRDDAYPLRDRAILAVMYSTGCRASEVVGLTSRDVYLDERFCRCLGKGNKERMVSLSAVAILALSNYLEHERPEMITGDDSGYLFVSRSGGQLSRVMIWKLVKKYAARIGVSKEVSPHTLRHSFATHMLAGGAEIRALQEMLGHASVRTTQVYTHVEHSRLKAIHQKAHPRG